MISMVHNMVDQMEKEQQNAKNNENNYLRIRIRLTHPIVEVWKTTVLNVARNDMVFLLNTLARIRGIKKIVTYDNGKMIRVAIMTRY